MNPLFASIATRRSAALVFAVALTGLSGVAVWAHEARAGDPALTIESNPAEVADHIARMSEHIYVEVQATAGQKERLDPILKEAGNDLAALHAQLRGGHDQVMALLAQPTVDRAALEDLRAAHMRTADEMSRRVVRLVADVADVLTPDQRRVLLERIAQHHGGGHGPLAWHHG